MHGGFLRRFWGTYLTAQNTRGLLHISSLPVKATSCHGIRVKSSPTFFFRSLAMNDLFMNYESPRATFFENHFFFFLFFSRIRLGLGSSRARPIIPTISRPVPAGHSLKRCSRCRKPALAPFFDPCFLAEAEDARKGSPISFSLPLRAR